MRICELPETDLRGGDEHAYYLDHLVRIAAEDGASHIVTLHLDSFPIRLGWAEELAGRLSASCMLATLDRINTACLFFGRDFYLQCRPTFRLSEAERANPEYRQYLKQHNPIPHSGIGYGFMAYSKGLSWYYLRRTHSDCLDCGEVYDEMLFHLRGAVQIGEGPSTKKGIFGWPPYRRFVGIVVSISRSILPVAVRQTLWAYLTTLIGQIIDQPRRLDRAQQIMRIEKQLFEDPEAYLSLLMKGGTGRPKPSRTL